MDMIKLIPLKLRREVTEILHAYKGATLPVYAEAERIRCRWRQHNIALEDIIGLFVEECGRHNVSIAFDPSEARDAMMGFESQEAPDGSRRSGDAVAADDVGRLLADHDGRGVGVGTADLRHDRRIAHPQAIEPMDPELRRNH